MSATGRLVLALAGITLAGGCRALSGEFRCERDEQCLTTTSPGRCQADGHCSVADASCPSGFRYLEASGSLSDQCVARLEDGGGAREGGAREGGAREGGALQVVWSADMETGDTSQWYAPCPSSSPCGSEGGREEDNGVASSAASQDIAHGGKWSLKLTITAPPEGGTRMYRWRESETHPKLHYSAWYYFPRRYSVPSYWNIFQWQSQVSQNQMDAFFVLNVGNRADGTMYLYLYNWQLKETYVQALKDLPVGQWTQIEADYWCAGDNTGRVTFWQDGTRLFDLQDVQTRYPSGDCRWSVNSGSDALDPSPATVYVDDAEISLAQ